jgi:hypothetical protein
MARKERRKQNKNESCSSANHQSLFLPGRHPYIPPVAPICLHRPHTLPQGLANQLTIGSVVRLTKPFRPIAAAERWLFASSFRGCHGRRQIIKATLDHCNAPDASAYSFGLWWRFEEAFPERGCGSGAR